MNEIDQQLKNKTSTGFTTLVMQQIYGNLDLGTLSESE